MVNKGRGSRGPGGPGVLAGAVKIEGRGPKSWLVLTDGFTNPQFDGGAQRACWF